MEVVREQPCVCACHPFSVFCVCSAHSVFFLLLSVYVLSCRTWTESKHHVLHTHYSHTWKMREKRVSRRKNYIWHLQKPWHVTGSPHPLTHMKGPPGIPRKLGAPIAMGGGAAEVLQCTFMWCLRLDLEEKRLSH